MTAGVWSPNAVGDLFMLIMPNGTKRLMRVTEIESPTSWKATTASIDDLRRLSDPPPEVEFHR